MNDAKEDLREFLDFENPPFVLARVLAYWTDWGLHAFFDAIRSASWLRQSQAVLVATIIAMHATLWAWGEIGGVLSTWVLVTGAVVITAGWIAIAGAAAGRIVADIKRPSTP